ncbi:GNAT family N-acetyltransferase [Maritalea sp.]|jgi:predicted GNAT superfamily acetyltransferase|uniref:GNAT family N-acetyltransferase n=1 Tax=Maritalea sp. TaxID=2003361 RepID=UPI0039E464B2
MSLTSDQFDHVLVLNNIHAKETSFLESADLQRLVERSYLTKTIGSLDAFLITMSHNSPHDGINFSWFKKRYESFAYIDRIVTAEHARGKGHAKKLYLDLMAKAKADGIALVCCEINHIPENPGSVAFHQKLGFEMIDTAALDEHKTVGYWIKKL